ncbi:MAG: hypothetical protein GY722_06940, partial [bacterium]|nr:hypothetical protein [bacterium]
MAGDDFAALDEVVTFAPGEHSKTVTVGIVADTAGERDEVYYVDLSEAEGGEIRYGRGTGKINTDDIEIKLIGGDDVVEGDSGNIVVFRRLQLSDPAP